MSSLYRVENVLQSGQVAEGSDRLHVPQVSYITGDLDIRDGAAADSEQVVFVNTLSVVRKQSDSLNNGIRRVLRLQTWCFMKISLQRHNLNNALCFFAEGSSQNAFPHIVAASWPSGWKTDES